MDPITHKECLRLIGQLCVQYGLPAGDPCWIGAKIGSYIESPLEEAIYKYRNVFANQQKLVKEWNSYRNQPGLEKRINLIRIEIQSYQPELNQLYKIISSYHTPDTRIDIDRRCYEK
jgi:hypothetical protein